MSSLWGDRRGLGQRVPLVLQRADEVTLTERLESFSNITQQGWDTQDGASLPSFVHPVQQSPCLDPCQLSGTGRLLVCLLQDIPV